MKKLFFLVLAILLLAATAISATCPEPVLEMKSSLYEKHKQPLVKFTHEKHFQPADKGGYGINCGECHHTGKDKKLTNLKAGDPVQKCQECHKKPGLFTKDSGLEKKDFHGESMHMQCTGCHEKSNKEKGTQAPTKACVKCHAKAK
jgi:hypothetical protein